MKIYKRNKKQEQNDQLGTKIRKFCMKIVVPKARKPSVETIGQKISFYSLRRKSWRVLTENKQNVDLNNIKNC